MCNCSLPFIRNITLAALAAFLLGGGTASAQSPGPHNNNRRSDAQPSEARPEQRPAVGVIARCHGDSVILRWAPTTPVAWQVGNASGYVVERYQLTRLGKPDSLGPLEKVLLTPQPLKPWPAAVWEPLAKGDKYAAIAVQSLHGKSFEVRQKSSSSGMGLANQAGEMENRHGFALFAADQSAPVAQALALRWVDKTVQKGEQYLYRVYPAQARRDYPVDTGFVRVAPERVLPLPKPRDLRAVFGNRTVELSWEDFYYRDLYTAYRVERSDDGGRTFRDVDGLPFLNPLPSGSPVQRMQRLDSLPDNDHSYVFRIRGLTPFAETSPPSDTVRGKGRESEQTFLPEIVRSEIFKNGQVLLKWRVANRKDALLKGFVVTRASRAEGPYQRLTRTPVLSSERSFVDSKAMHNNYYVVKALLKDNREVASLPFYVATEDSLPPAAPTGLAGQVNADGTVKLSWTANAEADLGGYRVFRGNGPSEEFTQVTAATLRETSFQDTIPLRTLSRRVYYRVLALDRRYNPSDFSPTLELIRPDVVPPAAPVFDAFSATDSTLELSWAPSSSEDVALYQLFRASANEEKKLVMESKTGQSAGFRDTGLQAGTRYQYALRARDEAGLYSQEAILALSTTDTGVRPAPEDIRVKVDRAVKQIQLGWKVPAAGIYRVLIYRAEAGGAIRLYQSVAGSSPTFTDRFLTASTSYQYRLKAIYTDGSESALSSEIKVTY